MTADPKESTMSKSMEKRLKVQRAAASKDKSEERKFPHAISDLGSDDADAGERCGCCNGEGIAPDVPGPCPKCGGDGKRRLTMTADPQDKSEERKFPHAIDDLGSDDADAASSQSAGVSDDAPTTIMSIAGVEQLVTAIEDARRERDEAMAKLAAAESIRDATIAEARPIGNRFHIENNQIVKNSNGEVLPINEPLFLIRARDYLAIPMLERYRKACVDNGGNDYILALFDEIIAEFHKFKAANPDKIKLPGITRGL